MLTETAILIALSTVLSMVKIFELPYGGSITAFSMVPIMIIAFRYGTKWGMFAGFVNSLVQLLFGLNTLSYATSAVAAVAIIMLDYVLAFSFIGLAGVFRKQLKDSGMSAIAGATLVCAIRYFFHVVSGCTVWAGISIPTGAALVYSLSYNATYMIPESIINIAMAFWLCKTLDFSGDTITRAQKSTVSNSTFIFTSLSVLSVIAAVIVSAVTFFVPLQNAETGELDFSLVSNVSLPIIIIAMISGLLLCIIFQVAAMMSKKKASS